MNDLALIRSALATNLGLTAKPGGLDGAIDGAPVQAGVTLVRQHIHGHHAVAVFDVKTGTLQAVNEPMDLQVDVLLPFRPKFDAGLQVHPVGGHAALHSAGKVGFAQRFQLGGKEPDRAAELVAEATRDLLDGTFVGDPGPRVTDAGVSWSWKRTPWPTVDEIAEVVRKLPPVWHAIFEASRRIRPPTGCEEAMVRLAGLTLPEGLELRGCPAGIAGRLDGVGVEVVVGPASERGWPVRLSVGLRTPLPGAPKVVREDRFGWLDRLGALLEGRSEILVGDKKFDQRFAVRSLKADALKEALVPAVRQGMLALDAMLPIDLDSTGIDGATTLKKPADLDKLVELVLDLAGALREAP